MDPREEKVLVYRLAEEEIKVEPHSFQEKVKAGIFEDLWIDFQEVVK